MRETHRGSLGAVVALGLALSLVGCSAATNAALAVGGGKAAGIAALTQLAGVPATDTQVGIPTNIPIALPSASPAPTGGSAWSDTTGCPQNLIAGERAIMSASGVSVIALQPTTSFGVPADPTLNKGMHPSCALMLVEGSDSTTEEIFLNMPQSYVATFTSRLKNGGFTLNSSASSATSNVLTKGQSSVDVAYFPQSDQSPFSYVVVLSGTA